MFIASKLKKENIAEYLLYMWQTEDVLRAFHLNMEKVNEHLIIPQNLPEDERKRLYEWYESIIEMMRLEDVQESGHIRLNKNILDEINEVHLKLLQGQNASYIAKFYHIAPYLTTLRQQSSAADTHDIEILFNFLYGIVLLRLQKKDISEQTLYAQKEISKFIALLSNEYKKDKEGNTDVDNE